MKLENVQEEQTAESDPAASQSRGNDAGGVNETKQKIAAFKFGGSSLFGADRMLHAAQLVEAAAQESQVIVVVSAMKGVTDRLLSIAHLLTIGKLSAARREAETLVDQHFDVLQGLELGEHGDLGVRHELQLLARDLLHEVPLNGTVAASAELFDRLASFGERFSARLFAAALNRSGVVAVPVASSEFVVTCDTFRDARPHLELSKQSGREILLPLLDAGIVPVVTGFIGATPDGRITTLGRNSSDFSGAIVAHVVDADELVIWTDVDGVFSANPHDSGEAKLLHELSYDEAYELAVSGAKVLHAKVLPLVAETEMIVWVRNTFNPQARGTRIASRRRLRGDQPSGLAVGQQSGRA
jgi:bifunctional aspartokinase / homoserine dehydrogenase 1